MRRAFTILAMVLCGLAAPPVAIAGPWARDAGDVFLSASLTAEEARNDLLMGLIQPDTTTGLYAEIGLGHRLTFGLDIQRTDSGETTLGFLRHTLTPPDATWQFAFDLGAGQRRTTAMDDSQLIRFGLSLGRGFGAGNGPWFLPMAHQGGWLTLDARATQDLAFDEPILQAEATIGLAMSDRLRLISTLKVEHWPGSEALFSYLPSLVYDIRPGTSVQLGGRLSEGGADVVGLTLGIWQAF